MNFIHPTAVIDSGAIIGKNNYFGPYCVVGANVEIGNFNRFEGHCSIGSQAEHKAYFMNGGKKVKIGTGNTIREFVTINMGTERETVMGNHCTMLRGSHLSHDSILEDHVTVSCNVLIGGHSHIMKWANLGLGSIIHQHQVIGSCVMLGMGAVITKKEDVWPGTVFVGNPAKFIKWNTVGLERAGIITIIGGPTQDISKELEPERERYIALRGIKV